MRGMGRSLAGTEGGGGAPRDGWGTLLVGAKSIALALSKYHRARVVGRACWHWARGGALQNAQGALARQLRRAVVLEQGPIQAGPGWIPGRRLSWAAALWGEEGPLTEQVRAVHRVCSARSGFAVHALRVSVSTSGQY